MIANSLAKIRRLQVRLVNLKLRVPPGGAGKLLQVVVDGVKVSATSVLRPRLPTLDRTQLRCVPEHLRGPSQAKPSWYSLLAFCAWVLPVGVQRVCLVPECHRQRNASRTEARNALRYLSQSSTTTTHIESILNLLQVQVSWPKAASAKKAKTSSVQVVVPKVNACPATAQCMTLTTNIDRRTRCPGLAC